MRAVSDEQLIEWVANGDSSCLGTLFERYHKSIYRFCLQMTRNNQHAEDVVQEVFMKVLKKAGSFRHDGTFKSWLFNIARNATLDYLRNNKRHKIMAPLDEHSESLLVDYQSAELAAAGAQKINILEKALAMSDDARHAAPGSEVKLQQGGRIVRADGEASDWSTLGEDFSALMDTPSIRGAATSLLGAGCLIPSPGAPSPLTANPFDQQFHKVSEVLGVVLGPRWHFEPVKRLPMPPCSVRCC